MRKQGSGRALRPAGRVAARFRARRRMREGLDLGRGRPARSDARPRMRHASGSGVTVLGCDGSANPVRASPGNSPAVERVLRDAAQKRAAPQHELSFRLAFKRIWVRPEEAASPQRPSRRPLPWNYRARPQSAQVRHPSWVWDYDTDEEQFCALLDGALTIGRLDRNWAAARQFDPRCRLGLHPGWLMPRIQNCRAVGGVIMGAPRRGFAGGPSIRTVRLSSRPRPRRLRGRSRRRHRNVRGPPRSTRTRRALPRRRRPWHGSWSPIHAWHMWKPRRIGWQSGG